MSTPSEPVAVLISDIHFTPSTLEVATECLLKAMEEALSLNVPLVISGDTLDSKAIIRAECANRLLEIFSDVDPSMVFMLVGNHDLLNEKGYAHSLKFLENRITVVQYPVYVERLGSYLIPYMSNSEALQEHLSTLPKGARIICHQGVQGAWMGHYAQDKTSLPPEAFADFRVISGHYHRAQDIKCGRPRKGAVGLFSYIGNPYTLSFGEADDGPKGYQVLRQDGTLTQVPIECRKHTIVCRDHADVLAPVRGLQPGDLLWLKVTGPKSELDKLNKNQIGQALLGHSNFKLDKIVTDTEERLPEVATSDPGAVLDAMIDTGNETSERKKLLKSTWRQLCESKNSK